MRPVVSPKPRRSPVATPSEQRRGRAGRRLHRAGARERPRHPGAARRRERGLSQTTIAQRLSRSATELFRMLAVLERRGYVARHGDGSYRLTLRLFELAHQHPPLKRLLTVALPAMQELAGATRQSNHLVDPLRAPDPRRRAGRQPRADGLRCAPGRALSVSPGPRVLARAVGIPAGGDAGRADRRAAGEQQPRPLGGDACARSSPRSRARASTCAPSDTADGVTDLCAPVFDHSEGAVAALTVPYLRQRDVKVSLAAARDVAAGHGAADFDRARCAWRGRLSRYGSSERPHVARRDRQRCSSVPRHNPDQGLNTKPGLIATSAGMGCRSENSSG